MDTVLSLIAGLCLLLGTFMMLSGGIGVLRFPDFFTRMHAAGVTETLAVALVLLGLMILAGWTLVLFKLVLILLFLLITSPTAGHALVKSALHGGLEPVAGQQQDKDDG